MATETLTQNLVFDVQFGAIRGDAGARRAIEDLTSSAMGAGVVRGVKQAAGPMEREMKRVLAGAMQHGLRKEGRELYKVFRDGSQEIVKARERVYKIDEAMRRTTNADHMARLRRDRAAASRIVKEEERHLKGKIKSLDKQAGRQAEMLEEAARNASKYWQDTVEKSAEKFSSLVSSTLDLKSGMPDPQQFGRSVGQGMSSIGKNLAGKSAQMAASGGTAAAMAGVVAALGTAAAAIAGVAVAIGALVAIVAAAYGQTKELNTAILSAQTASDSFNVMASRGKGLAKTLTNMRQAARASANRFRESTEVMTTFASELSASGMLMRDWRGMVQGATTDQEAYRKVMEKSYVASQTFGVGAQEVGEFGRTLMYEMGRQFDEVNSAYTAIFRNAQKSGMATKNFFTAINEASTGMALYNFRLEDTAALLTKMSDILGEDLAKGQIRMTGTYRGMSQEERTRTVINAGGTENAQRIMRASFDALNKENVNMWASLAEEAGPVFAEIMNEAGTGLDIDLMAGLDSGELGDMLKVLRDQGKGAEARRIENMWGLARGQRGGLGAAATGIGSLDRQGELAMQLSEASTLLGKEGIGDMEGLTRQTYESITNRSGEDFEILQRLDRAFRADFKAAGGEEGTGKDFAEWVTGQEWDPALGELTEMMAMTTMERLSMDQVKETKSIAQLLKNMVGGWLEKIFVGVSFLSNLFGRDQGGEYLGLADTSMENMDEIMSLIDMNMSQRIDMESSLAGETDPDKLEEGLAVVAQLKLNEQALRDQMDIERDAYAAYMDLASGGTGDIPSREADMDLARSLVLDQNLDPASKLIEWALGIGVDPEVAAQQNATNLGKAAPRQAMLGGIGVLTPALAMGATEDLTGAGTRYNVADDPGQFLAATGFGMGGEGWTPAVAGEHYPLFDPQTASGGYHKSVRLNPETSDREAMVRQAHIGELGEEAFQEFLDGAWKSLYSHEGGARGYVEDPQYDSRREAEKERQAYAQREADLTAEKAADPQAWAANYGDASPGEVNMLQSYGPGTSESMPDGWANFSEMSPMDELLQEWETMSTYLEDPEGNEYLKDIVGIDKDEAVDVAKQVTLLERIAADMEAQNPISSLIRSTGMTGANLTGQFETEAEWIKVKERLVKRRGTTVAQEGGVEAYLQAKAYLDEIGRAKGWNDFYDRGDGPVSFSSDDTIVGFKGASPLGGGVNININGGDEAQVYRVVRKALRASGRR